MRRQVATAAGLFLVVGSSACSPRTATPVAEPKVKVVDVALGRTLGADKRVAVSSATFAPTDVVYASVVTEGDAKRATLTARWTYQASVVGQTAQDIAPRGHTVTEFHVFNPAGWAAGEYRVEILLDGRVMADRSFRVGAEKP